MEGVVNTSCKGVTMMGKMSLFRVVCHSVVIGCFILALISASVHAAEGTISTKQPRYGGTLKFADYTDGIFIGYPPKCTRNVGIKQVSPAIETLFRYDKAGKPAPYLASGVKEDPRAKTITLTLRKWIKFHDGTDFNAEAVKWNLDQCIAAKIPGTDKFKSVDAVDEYTARINLNEWDSTITGNLTQAMGMIVSPTACQKNGIEWCGNNPVGTGPFMFVSWQKNVRTTFKKFPGYWQKGKPYLDAIEFAPVTDPVTRLMSFKAKEFDIALTIDPIDVADLEKNGHVVTRRKLPSGVETLIPSSANADSPWANLKVRQAAQYAIDTQALAKTIAHGEAEPATQYAIKESWAYNPAVKGYPYNPARARQLLAEAGYPNGFKTKILHLADRNAALYAAVQGYLKEVGIDAELDPMDYGRLQKNLWGGSYEGLHLGSGGPTADPVVVLTRLFYSPRTYVSMMKPDDYVKAISNAIAAPDYKTKQKWVQEVMKLITEKYCLMITLFGPTELAVGHTFVHDHGFLAYPDTKAWTPEKAWKD